MKTNKPKVIKDYGKLSEELLAEIKQYYPYGYEKHLIKFTNAKGEIISAFPYEGEQFSYLIKMTKQEAKQIDQEEDDFDEDEIVGEEINQEMSQSDEDLD